VLGSAATGNDSRVKANEPDAVRQHAEKAGEIARALEIALGATH
jgi:hypothetical protein